jgi:hypothetical protein
MPDQTTFHVWPKHNAWEVTPARAGVAARYSDKERAVREACRHAREIMPSKVLIHSRDGQIETQYAFDEEAVPVGMLGQKPLPSWRIRT